MTGPGYQPVGRLRRQVRAGVAAWISSGGISGLTKVHRAFPRRMDFSDAGASPHRCQAVVFLSGDSEARIALGGPHSGRKRVTWTVELELYHHSVARDPDHVADHFDDVVDQIKDLIRSDHRFGDDTGVIFQAGEGPYGLQVEAQQPRIIQSEAIETWANLRFVVEAIITA